MTTTPLRVSIDTGFSNLASQMPGGASLRDQRWDGDRLAFGLGVLGQHVSGSVEVLETTVTIDIELPGLLGRIAGAFRRQLQKAGQRLLLAKD
jgi:hypothetical protein